MPLAPALIQAVTAADTSRRAVIQAKNRVATVTANLRDAQVTLDAAQADYNLKLLAVQDALGA